MFFFGEHTKVFVHKVQVIGPVVAPVALSEVTVYEAVGEIDNGCEGILNTALIAHLQKKGVKGTGSVFTCYKFLDFLGVFGRKICKKGFRLVSGKSVGKLLYSKRIVAVQLNEAVELLNVFFVRKGGKESVHTAVLVNVSVACVTLGIKLGKHREEIVISLGIAVLS